MNLLHPSSDNKQPSNPCVASVTGHKVMLVVGFGFWGAANFPCCAFFLQFPSCSKAKAKT